MTFKPANCPECGGALQVPDDDKEYLNCMYCGSNIKVREVIKVEQTANLDNILELAQASYDGCNFEEAYRYYSRILEYDNSVVEAWYGKGLSAGILSSFASLKTREMTVSFKKVFELTDGEEREEYEKRASMDINTVVIEYLKLFKEHFEEYVDIDGAWNEYLQRCKMILEALKFAHYLNPTHKTIVNNVIHICKDNLEGVIYLDSYDNKKKFHEVGSTYREELSSTFDEYVGYMKELDTEYTPPLIQVQENNSCFVVTATMGRADDPIVVDMQRFRDDVLNKFFFGKLLVKTYYKIGPCLAKIIRNKKILRKMSFIFLIKPIHKVISKNNKTS